uniref:CSON014125 protein n=1 Tax=Culicoides sonorensis TaxID=179676 RepID=A0A336MM06_CULSO
MSCPAKKYLKYDIFQLKKAIAAVQNGLTLSRASREFNIPRQTLAFKIKNNQTEPLKSGPKTNLSYEQEVKLVNWIIEGASVGDPKNSAQIKNAAWFFTKFVSIIGPDLIKEFEDPNFLAQVEYKKKLYDTYNMLHEMENERLKPLTLPAHKIPKRRGKIIEKRHFVSVGEDYINLMKERKQKKEEEEMAKQKRKEKREEKKTQKENMIKIKAEQDEIGGVKRRGRPKKDNVLKDQNINLIEKC